MLIWDWKDAIIIWDKNHHPETVASEGLPWDTLLKMIVIVSSLITTHTLDARNPAPNIENIPVFIACVSIPAGFENARFLNPHKI